MDYTLHVFRTNGLITTIGCATTVDVCNNMASYMRSQFDPDIAAESVSFQVIRNF